jgi:hypothetical protein
MASSMPWRLSHRCDPFGREIADRHYNRQSVGAPNFVPPGRCLVLTAQTDTGRALWVTSYPFAEYVRHEWAGAWVCSAFRNEGAGLSSDLIRAAVRATVWRYGPAPEPHGFITFVDRGKTRPKKNPGFCYLKAGWEPCGKTKGGLTALRLPPERMPDAEPPQGATLNLFGV